MSSWPSTGILMVKKPLRVYELSNLPLDCAQSGWESLGGFWSAGHPGSLCTTSPLSSAGSLVSSHNSRTAVVGNQDLAVNNQVSACQAVTHSINLLCSSVWLILRLPCGKHKKKKKQPDLSPRGRCHWCWSQVLCLTRAAELSPSPTSSSFPRPLYSLSQSAVGTWREERDGGVNKATLRICLALVRYF